jgi:hypothetical protein
MLWRNVGNSLDREIAAAGNARSGVRAAGDGQCADECRALHAPASICARGVP